MSESDGTKVFWLSAAFVVVIAIGGYNLWRAMNSPTQDDLTALNHKLDDTNARLKLVQKATDSAAMSRRLTNLANNIETTNKALGGIQKTIAASNVGERLDQVDKSIKGIETSLTSLQKNLASLQNKTQSPTDLADQIGPLNEKIKTLSNTLADIQKSTSLDSVKTQLAALNSKLEEASKAVAVTNQDDTAALKSEVEKLKASIADVGKLKDTLKPPPKEAVVFYLHMPNEKNLPRKVASVQPLDIQFEKIGSTDDNGQAAFIIPKLKALVEGRKDCTISVAGYADTLGSDKLNLKISQQRAQNIAQKIKTAIPDVTVNVAAWGERRLQNWTPDATADEANRRVDIGVNCKG